MPQAFLSAGFITAVVLGITASGAELFGGEGNAAEELTGIFGTAGIVAAFLFGDAVVQYGHHQLGIPLQTDDGKLSQRHKQPPLVAGEHQFLIEHPPDGCRNLADDFTAAAVADILDAGTENHGIQNFHCEHQFDRYN